MGIWSNMVENNHKSFKSSFRTQSLVIVLIGIFAFSAYMPQNTFAEISYDEKIKFVSILEQIKGHLAAANENHYAGNLELTKLHLSHPIEENKMPLDNLLKLNPTSVNTDLVLTMIKNMDHEVLNGTFYDSTLASTKLLDSLKENILGEQNNPDFNLQVINHLLEQSKLEYNIGKSSIGNFGILEIQDSYAFAVRAHILFMEIDEIKTQDKKEINDIFMELLEKHKQQESVSVIVNLENKIINKINKIINNLDSATADDQSIPSWIKNNAKWWSEDSIDDITFVSGIQFLITERTINILNLPDQGVLGGQGVPDWVKINAGWWANDLLPDVDFINGIKYLVEQGIIKVDF